MPIITITTCFGDEATILKHQFHYARKLDCVRIFPPQGDAHSFCCRYRRQALRKARSLCACLVSSLDPIRLRHTFLSRMNLPRMLLIRLVSPRDVWTHLDLGGAMFAAIPDIRLPVDVGITPFAAVWTILPPVVWDVDEFPAFSCHEGGLRDAPEK
ncbi:hypothetical protein C8J57DRAFT_1232827 [Mycena rebaudengoi]|nr:hypothetical protein C8J57DRAFT_1232827 [Mycena rebaudengoi]